MQLAGCNDGNNKISECFLVEEEYLSGPIKRASTSENYLRQSCLTSKLFRSIKGKFVGVILTKNVFLITTRRGLSLDFAKFDI